MRTRDRHRMRSRPLRARGRHRSRSRLRPRTMFLRSRLKKKGGKDEKKKFGESKRVRAKLNVNLSCAKICKMDYQSKGDILIFD